jgi:integrase
LLPITESLSRKVSEYVMKVRRAFPAARRHKFLLVVHQAGPYQGAPLSAKGLGKIFSVIKSVDPETLKDFSPHVLRHTANDEFSELMDEIQVRPADEEKMRSYTMGWREGSGTAATYTKRHTQKKAREASLKLQQRTTRNSNDSE